jgi:hypothetical protein
MPNFLQKFSTCLSRVMNYIFLLQYFWTDSVLFCFMHCLSFKSKSFWLVWVYEKEYNITYLLDIFHAFFLELHAASIMLFMPTNVTPQKKRWEISLCWSFSQELEELRQVLFKNGENHKLGDIKTPLDYTLLVYAYLLFVFLSTQFYRINLEHLL